MNNIIHNILSDIRVELKDEFDQNFRRGAFFDKRWKAKRDGSASTLQQTGTLRKSIRSQVRGNSVVFTSSVPYADIHNQGGQITVTKKMQRYFWAKYHASGKKSDKAQTYKAMALKKVGSKITIPQRQFIGDHPQVRASIKMIVDKNIEDAIDQITQNLKK